jgi:hypothetical protein
LGLIFFKDHTGGHYSAGYLGNRFSEARARKKTPSLAHTTLPVGSLDIDFFSLLYTDSASVKSTTQLLGTEHLNYDMVPSVCEAIA